MSWVTNIPESHDFLSLVAACAPNDFPVEDYLPDEEQLTLSLAFSELQNGLALLNAADGREFNHSAPLGPSTDGPAIPRFPLLRCRFTSACIWSRCR